MTDLIIAADEAHRDMMARGSNWLLRQIESARTGKPAFLPRKATPPETLVWNRVPITGSTWTPDERKDRSKIERRLAYHAQKEALAERLYVSRDPCPLCAVRADVGCRHRRAA